MPSLVTERIESVKAGIFGAGAFALSELTISIVKYSVVNLILKLDAVAISWDITWLVQLTIALVSGFLFGVTYRYIIRDDRNSHLNDGAVMAFGLVRGLALVESNLMLSELLSVLFLIIQSIVCFAIARYVLDLAINRKLIKPFIS
ncbi:MAG: hypothetical protein AAGF83_23510 [Cyanobacteria bacterium P01_G01_bin.67]